MVWVVVVAAGRGTRYGGAKQLEVIGGRRVVDWSVRAARAVADGIVLVLDGDPIEPVECVVSGGATRSDSVRAGLAAVPADAEIVVVHDAARPAASPALFRSVVEAVRAGADGAVPGVPVVDTIKRVDGSLVVETPARDELVAVQTPQAFRAEVLRAAHASGADASDDAALVEAAGGRVVIVPGEPSNRKLTTPADREAVERALS
jgi:2-C-methyl-D-erythritol 4-phosphate cytidylyltransferase